MAQHDYNLANATGVAFRGDMNALALAIATVNSGATEPAVKFPGMLWLDLSAGGDGTMRRRNQANSAWLTDIGIDQTARNQASAAQTTANAALPRTGGTMTGAIILPGGEPTNNQAMSRAAADALYQVRLPTAQGGALLVGTAAGWTTMLPPAAEGTIVTISGGVPVWQNTGTVAAPGVVVRTQNDGTIDPSFIPQVASGLRFCGTFRPAVNFEYPTTGGHGAAGAPAIGDFWIIDGLTTGGFTYLTGSLAGVTVYNGDSIAYNGAGAWFRMGSTVNLQGYLKTDGSIAMAGPLNMGGYAINNVNGIAGRAGAQVPLTNFKIDSSNIVISPQRGTTGADLPVLQAGQLGTDAGRMQIFVGSSSTNIGMLPVRFFSTTAAYAAGEYVAQAGALYRAGAAIASGSFVRSQWRQVADDDYANFNVDVQSGTGIFKTTVAQAILASVAGAAGAVVLRPNGPASLASQFVVDMGQVTFNGFTVYHAGNLSPVTLNTEQVITAFKKISVGALATPAGNFKSALSLEVASANTDSLQFFSTRRQTGSDWATASWIVRRAVDVTTEGYIEFGGTAGGAPLLLGVTDQAAMLIDWDRNVWVPGNVRVDGVINTKNVGPMINGEGFQFQWNATVSGSGRNEYTNNYGGGLGGHVFYERTNTSANKVSIVVFDVVGNVTALSFNPTCDERIKENIHEVTPRDLSSAGLYDYAYSRNGVEGRGPIAQRVQEVAPEYVNELKESEDDPDPLLTVNLMGLTYEMTLNLAERVRVLEAMAFAPTGDDDNAEDASA